MLRLSRKDLEDIDRRLGVCARSGQPLLLALGKALLKLSESDLEPLGFSSFPNYVRQCIQRDMHWVDDLVRLTRRLACLPWLREALWRTEVSMSAGHLLAPHLTPANERAWADVARNATVRQLRALLREALGPSASPPLDDDDEPTREVTRVVPPEVKTLFDLTRMRLERLEGRKLSGDALLMPFVAECETELLGSGAPLGPGFDADRLARAVIAREENRAAREAAEGRAEPALPPRPPVPDLEEIELPADLVDLARYAKFLADQLAMLDLEIGRLAAGILRKKGWKRLGYGSPEQYATERACMSLRSLRSRKAVAAKCQEMPVIAEAVVSRDIGFSVATMLAHTATPASAAAWVERSKERTVKHLQEEVHASRFLEIARPPDPVELETFFEAERRVIGKLGDPAPTRQISGPSEALSSVIRFGNSTEWWQDRFVALEQQYGALGRPHGDFMTFACLCVWKAFPIAPDERAYLDSRIRDRGRCTCPLCSKTNVHDHHVKPRSQGGSEDLSNRTSTDDVCHLGIIHGGNGDVRGRAPFHLTWELGPPHARYRIEGRKLVAKP